MHPGGAAGGLVAGGDSILEVSGGTILYDINLEGNATLFIRGGDLAIDIDTQANNTIEITGNDFTVDDIPVPYGSTLVSGANLKGTLPNGGSLDVNLDVNAIPILLIEALPPASVPSMSEHGGAALITLLALVGTFGAWNRISIQP